MVGGRERRVGAGSVVILGIVLAGCSTAPSTPAGVDITTVTPTPLATTSSAAEIRDQMLNALESNQSVHVLGSLVPQGGVTAVDVTANRLRQVRGTVTVDGVVIDVMRDGDTLYVRAPNTFWSARRPDLLPAASGKWVRMPAASPVVPELTAVLDYDRLVGPVRVSGDVTQGPTSFLEAESVIELVTSSGSVFVRASDTPLPVALRDRAFGDLRYTEWGAAVPIPAPVPAEIAELPPSPVAS